MVLTIIWCGMSFKAAICLHASAIAHTVQALVRLRKYNYAAENGSFVWFKNVSDLPVHLVAITWDGNEVRDLLQLDSFDASCRSCVTWQL